MMNQDALDHEIGASPPSTVDIDVIIARQRRRVRYQHIGLAASVGAMVVAIGLVLTMLPRAGGSPHLGAGATPTQSATPTNSTGGGSRQQEAARLTAVLKQLMASALPEAQFLPDPLFPGTKPLVFIDQGNSFSAAAEIKDSAGIGSISATVGPDQTSLGLEGGCPNDPPPHDVTAYTCKVQPGADGANIMVLSDTIGKLHYQRHLAVILRTDGNSVSVDIANGVVLYKGQRPSPPLDANQTVTLATNPQLATTLS